MHDTGIIIMVVDFIAITKQVEQLQGIATMLHTK